MWRITLIRTFPAIYSKYLQVTIANSNYVPNVKSKNWPQKLNLTFPVMTVTKFHIFYVLLRLLIQHLTEWFPNCNHATILVQFIFYLQHCWVNSIFSRTQVKIIPDKCVFYILKGFFPRRISVNVALIERLMLSRSRRREFLWRERLVGMPRSEGTMATPCP